MATKNSKAVEELNNDFKEHLSAFSSTLAAFEVAAEAAVLKGRDIDAWGMFMQCNKIMGRILELHDQLEEEILKVK